MIPELAANIITSQLTAPATASAPSQRTQIAFQKQLNQAREERQPDPSVSSDGPPKDTDAAKATSTADHERRAERARTQANAAQRRSRQAEADQPATPDKPASGRPADPAQASVDAREPQPAGTDSASNDSSDEDPATPRALVTSTTDPALTSLLAASRADTKAAMPATKLSAASEAADAAGSGTARSSRQAITNSQNLSAATVKDGIAAATDEPTPQGGIALPGEEKASGTAFEGKLTQARQSLPAEMLRGMSAPAGNELAALQTKLDAAAAPSAPSAVTSVQAPVGSQAFAPEFTERISTMIDGGIERAEILVTPKDMGPVRIELTLSGADARLVFTAAHPDTRQAIEQSSALLRSMLADHGLTLGGMDVNQGNTGNPQQAHQPQGPDSRGQAPSVGSQAPSIQRGGSGGARRGLLDMFA